MGERGYTQAERDQALWDAGMFGVYKKPEPEPEPAPPEEPEEPEESDFPF